jgi:hypothetical protein
MLSAPEEVFNHLSESQAIGPTFVVWRVHLRREAESLPPLRGKAAGPQAGDVGLNPRVLLFAVATSAVTSVLFSLFPALAGSSVDLSQGLRAAGRGFFGGSGRKRAAQVLVALEVALSFLLLAGAGLLMSSVLHLESERLGFDVRGIATASAQMPQRYSTRESREAFERTLRERLQAMPVPPVTRDVVTRKSRVAQRFGAHGQRAEGGTKCAGSRSPGQIPRVEI